MSGLTEQIIGTWMLRSWTYRNGNGVVVDHIGLHPVGTLTYTSGGQMSVQIMRGDRKKFASGGLMDGTAEEIREAFTSFFSYFGTYEERKAGEFLHHIEGSNFPNWVGETEIRYAKILGDHLTLSAPGHLPDGNKVLFEVKWEKVD